jgi:hypothetical protein
MRRTAVFLLAAMVLAWGAQAQTSANAQANAASSAQVGSRAAQAGVQAQSSTSASASRTTEPSSRGREKGNRQHTTSASAANGNSASASAGPAAIQLDSGTMVNAVLVKSLDARKCKPGEEIEARTVSDVKQHGHLVLRKGSRLYGHVTQAQARTKGNAESSLGLAFDSVVMRDGKQVPLHLGVHALAAAWADTAASAGDEEGMVGGGASAMGAGAGRAGGGLLGGAGGTVGGAEGLAGGVRGNAGRVAGRTVGTATQVTGSAAGNVGGLDASGRLLSSSGVFGLQGLQLTSAASNATEGSLVTSNTRNVHLDSGTQMVLSAAKQ